MFAWQPIILSLKIAGIALLSVAVGGIALAFFLIRRNFHGKAIVETLITLPLVLPPVVTGFVLLLLIGRKGPLGLFLKTFFASNPQLVFTPAAAVLAAVCISFPLMFQSAKAALQGVDKNFEEAARTLGAGEWRIFFTITLPLAWPGLLTGMVMAFARALGEFGATAMVAGNIPGKTQTIPVAIYFAAENNDLATAGSYVLFISLLTFALIFWVNRWSDRKIRQEPKGGESIANGQRQKRTTRVPA